ncbi:hypothetical protein E2C01_002598 [Portunus trituberculatus]|uniref:Uncharacterized protein n=1 Tax=Portunus trituberculatus TaxID=210409 RepID=A0A5B7CNP2_PORTR|nr:hypothetical protein [Portunus trituberculatus]
MWSSSLESVPGTRSKSLPSLDANPSNRSGFVVDVTSLRWWMVTGQESRTPECGRGGERGGDRFAGGRSCRLRCYQCCEYDYASVGYAARACGDADDHAYCHNLHKGHSVQ